MTNLKETLQEINRLEKDNKQYKITVKGYTRNETLTRVYDMELGAKCWFEGTCGDELLKDEVLSILKKGIDFTIEVFNG